jgi:hypothetical protein
MVEESGFNDATKNADSSWEAWINDRHFTFSKARRKGGAYLYTCQTKIRDKTSVTSFFSERDLSPDELEGLPQFIAFISATM